MLRKVASRAKLLTMELAVNGKVTCQIYMTPKHKEQLGNVRGN
jgi:hypothetical protein